MTQSPVEPGRSSAGLDNATTYNFISTLAHKTGFLYSTGETFIVDTHKENRSEAEQIWQSTKDDKANKHIRIKGQSLIKGRN